MNPDVSASFNKKSVSATVGEVCTTMVLSIASCLQDGLEILRQVIPGQHRFRTGKPALAPLPEMLMTVYTQAATR